MPKNSLNVALKGVDEIFSTEESRHAEQREQVQQIPIAELFPFKNHPFRVQDDEEMENAVKSISQYGVLTPLIARLTAPENGQISTIYPKRGELVGAGTPIMSLVVLDDCHVVLNVREDYMHYFRMNETFRGNVPALKVENIEFKIYYISPLGSFATWRSTKQTGTYDMKTFEIHALPLQPVDGLRPGMSVLVNLNELK